MTTCIVILRLLSTGTFHFSFSKRADLKDRELGNTNLTVLYIAPSVLAFYSHMANWESRYTINTYVTLIGYADSMNDVIVVVVRQRDIRTWLYRFVGLIIASWPPSIIVDPAKQQHSNPISLRQFSPKVSPAPSPVPY